MEMINAKLWVDEIIPLTQGTGEVIPQKLTQYDPRNNLNNEKFLPTVFKVPLSILPL